MTVGELIRELDKITENEGFQKALIATKGATLTHSIGKNKPSETVLTTKEFISRLTKIRNDLQK